MLRYLQNLLKLYCTLVRPKLEYASVAWNSVTANDAGKLERIQCFSSSFLQPLTVQLRLCPKSPEILYLSVRNRHLDTLFFFMSTLVQNASLSVWKPSTFVCPFEISQFLLCLMLALNVSTVLPLDAILLTRFKPMPVFTVRSCQHVDQPPSWRTTPYRQSATAYSIYSQLPSVLEAAPRSAA